MIEVGQIYLRNETPDNLSGYNHIKIIEIIDNYSFPNKNHFMAKMSKDRINYDIDWGPASIEWFENEIERGVYKLIEDNSIADNSIAENINRLSLVDGD